MKPRLLFVIGKGGVGRSSVTAGLALAAGRAGKRALAIELNGVADIGRRFGHQRSYEPLPIGPNTEWRSLTTRECVVDFGRRRLHLGAISTRLMGSRPLQRFLDAIPGLPDLLQLGKIENLLNEPLSGEPVYDLVVVDTPATGHGLSFLDAARTLTEVSKAGPFHDLAQKIAVALADGTSGVVVTSLPEHLPLTETLELLEALKDRTVPLEAVVLNRMLPCPVPDLETWPAVRATLEPHPHLRELTDGLLRAWHEQQEVQARLTQAVRVPIHLVPLDGPPADPQTIVTALASA